MTNWTKVTGSQAEKPVEFDTTSSKKYVYQRRNIERIKVESEHGESELWQYDERKMSFDEYNVLMLQMSDKKTRADVEYIAIMSDIELEA